jgi:hypothetical protein
LLPVAHENKVLILYSGFKEDQPKSNTYIAWYVVAVVEIAINIIVSSMWKVVSFKGTHLVQRMSLLTLIILGEGIISMTKSIANIVENYLAYTPATVGNIIAAVLLIYFLYQLYFDWLNIHEHFGTIRQQIWAFLHFPFHLFLVLSLAGTAQVIVVRKVTEVTNYVGGLLDSNSGNVTNSTLLSNFTSALNITITNVFEAYAPKSDAFETYSENLSQLQDAATNSTVQDLLTNSTLFNAYSEMVNTVQNSIYASYNIEIPETNSNQQETSEEQLEQYLEVFGVLVSPNFPFSLRATNKPPTTVYLLLRDHGLNSSLDESPELPLHFPQILGTPLHRRLASVSLQHLYRRRPLRYCSSSDSR